MRRRHDLVLIAISIGLLALAAVTTLLAIFNLLPDDILAWCFWMFTIVYGLPFAFLLAVVAAIVYHADRKIEQRFKN